MTDRELIQQALNALNRVMSHGSAVQEAKDILRDRLAQPEQGPIAWSFRNWQYDHIDWGKQRPDDEIHTIPLCTAQPQCQSRSDVKLLTDEEVLNMARTFGAQPWPPGSCLAFARAIEAAHGIKGEA